MAAPWQRPSAIALVLLLLTGCSRPTPTPPSPTTQEPSAPAAFAPGAGCLTKSGEPPVGGVGSAHVREGTCLTYIHADPVIITFLLPPEVWEQTARDALQVAGATPAKITFRRSRTENYLSVQLPAGKAGEEVTVRLSGPVGRAGAPAGMAFRLQRRETPQITTEVKLEGSDWQPLTPGATLPAKPLQLRLTLTGQPKRDRVESAVQEGLRHKGALSSATLAWEGENRLLVTVPEPPPLVFLRLDWLEAGYGLQVQRSTVAFYTGEAPPRLVALDPATGQETAVGEMPVDVLDTSISPDGAWAVLTAVAPDSAEREQVWVVNTRTGERWLTGFTADWTQRSVYWLPGRMLLPAVRAAQIWDLAARTGRRVESETWFWGGLSPDRRYLAGSVVDLVREDESTWLAPASIVLFDLERLTEKVYPDVATAYVQHSSAPVLVPMAWEKSTLLYEDVTHRDPKAGANTSRWRSLDPATGTTADASPPVAGAPAPTWLKGSAGWEYRPDGSWSTITLRSPQGVEQSFGQGFPVGWRPDGKLLLLRWPNFPYLRRTEGI